MSHHWLLITVSWLGTASLQYINSGPSASVSALAPLGPSAHYSLPYTHYFDQPPNLDTFQDSPNEYLQEEDAQRKRRTTDDNTRKWLPNLVDTDMTKYFTKNEEIATPFVVGYHDEDNSTEVEKKNFSPWGGKRDGASTFENMWSWKRSLGIREPSMPKRVRFSQWGGKRSGQIIFKPGTRGSNIVYASSIPELALLASQHSSSGQRFKLAGFQFIPGMNKRHPIKILALSTNMDDKTLREAMPYNEFFESTQKIFKPGHPYNEVHMKKDGNRKMKFSIWGGKRSPPIIGPIWTPAPQDAQDSALDTVLLLRNKQEELTKAL